MSKEWKLHQSSPHSRYDLHIDGECVAALYTDDANARLIAAAPALLEACKIAALALKDIIGAADNDMPYTRDELIQNFMDDCNKIEDVIYSTEAENV